MVPKPRKAKTVLATGVFDILHLGHIHFLEESKRIGGRNARLVVIVARDATVLKRKGRPPVLPEKQRQRIVATLKPVDTAVLGYQHLDFLGILQRYQPDVVAFGYDQTDMMTQVEKLIRKKQLPIRVAQVRRFSVNGLDSSTGIKRKVAASLAGKS